MTIRGRHYGLLGLRLVLAACLALALGASSSSHARADGPALKNNGLIAFDCGNQICTSDSFGHHVQTLTASFDGNASRPEWSPDGSKITFSGGTGCSEGCAAWNVYVMNANGTNITPVTTSGSDFDPSFSANGSTIFYEHDQYVSQTETTSSTIWKIAADGSGQPSELAGSGDPWSLPMASPDGTKLAFVLVGSDSGDQIGVYDLVTHASSIIVSANVSESDREPVWAPDSSKIYFNHQGFEPDTNTIESVAPSGGDTTTVIGDPAVDPAPSPDGTEIAFYASSENTPSGIYVQNLDGSPGQQILNGDATSGDPAWQPVDCTPGAGQVALFTAKSFKGSCAVYGTGAHGDLTANGGIPDNSAKSIKIGSGAYAVLHRDSNFGNGCCDDAWFNAGADQADLSSDQWGPPTHPFYGVYPVRETVADDGVSSLWVMPSTCTTGPQQVSVWALTSFGGGCVTVGTGDHGTAIDEGIPNDWVNSIEVGSRVTATLIQNANNNPAATCSLYPGTRTDSLCPGTVGNQELTGLNVDPATPTPATATIASAQSDGTTTTTVAGSIHGTAAAANLAHVTLVFYSGSGCSDETNGTLLGTTSLLTDVNGNATFNTGFPTGVTVGQTVSVALKLLGFGETVPSGSACAIVTPLATNTDWVHAKEIVLDSNGNGSDGNSIDQSGQARWYKFAVQPGQGLDIKLTNLPANYDLALFSDIGQAFNQLNNTSDLQQLSAEFAPSAFAPSAFAPSAFAPSAFAPSAFAPSAFAPSAFAPSAFAPSAFAPSAFASFSDANGSYESAQIRSFVAYSAADGTADEHIVANTWNNTGYFYIRVTGRNGAYTPAMPFAVNVHEDAGQCGGVQAPASPIAASIPAGTKTLIVADFARMPQGAALTQLQTDLNTFKARSEVGGYVLDLNSLPAVQNLYTQADTHLACPYAENVTAEAIRDIINAYRQSAGGSSLKYIVVVGNDHEVPFFRYPDASGLGTESSYVPPVADNTASQASLRLDYVLSQDAYGTLKTIHLNGVDLPVPDLPVGRLVETPSEIDGVINAYLGGTTAGSGIIKTKPTSSLVTGYDFLQSSATSVEGDLSAGLGAGATNDQLITNQGVPASDVGDPPLHSWNADRLRAKLFAGHHDFIFLGGHFSADNLLAADYTTTIDSTELVASTIDLSNSIVVSPGCHSGYNIVDSDALQNITQPVDWVQAFAQKKATVIAGTGYQYGDTDFLAYSAKLYANFAHDLRAGTVGTGVPVGGALVTAKQQYLNGVSQLSGIDEKALLESTLYGLPMLAVNLPAGRTGTSSSGPSTVTPALVNHNPGQGLGLQTADVEYMQTPQQQSKSVAGGNGSFTAKWLSGASLSDVLSTPGAPALPLYPKNVTVPNLVLRGVGFTGGTFADVGSIFALAGAPTTELNAPHTLFASPTFFPEKLWTVNYFGGVENGSTVTQLLLTPAQYKSDGSPAGTDIQRTYGDVKLRLYYSGLTSSKALVGAPTISRVDGTAAGNVSVHVVGDPAVGIHEVWVTYLSGNTWASTFLTQDGTDTTLWTGSIPSTSAGFMVQAANGVGLVTLDTNGGAFYQLGKIPPALASSLTSTSLQLTAASHAAWGSQLSVSATLGGATPLAGQTVTFTLGGSTRTATTNGSGVAMAQLPLMDNAGSYTLTATFNGDATNASSKASQSFTIDKLPTTLALAQSGYVVFGTDTGVVATLTSGGTGVSQKTVEFQLTPTSGPAVIQTSITDGSGRAALGPVPLLAPGTYTVKAWFGSGGPLPPTLSDDPVFSNSSNVAGTVHVTVNTISPSSIGSLTVSFVQGSAAWASATPGMRTAITQQLQNLTNNQLSQIVNGPPSARAGQLTAYKSILTSLQSSGWLTATQVAILYNLATKL